MDGKVNKQICFTKNLHRIFKQNTQRQCKQFKGTQEKIIIQSKLPLI